jgi:hypothetical protein
VALNRPSNQAAKEIAMAEGTIAPNEASVNLLIIPTGRYTSRGEVYEVKLGDELLARGVSPEFDAVRILLGRGHTCGFAYFWRQGKENWDFRIPLPSGAKWRVLENSRTGPRFVKWEPFDPSRIPPSG